MNRPPRVAVVVACTRPGRIAAIAEVLGAEADVACELVVAGDVADLPADGWAVPTTLVPVAERHPNHRRRAALEASTAPVVAFLDDDAVPAPGWLREAASLPDDATFVWTGPEVPTRTTPGAELAWSVASSLLAEGSRAHVERDGRSVRWYEAPFCNLVTSRRLLERVGPPALDIAWDTDDFDWCAAAAAGGATFHNRPALGIAHDRYPDDLTDWLARKAAERRRTGEKLVRYPGLYLRVPGVVVGAAAPWVAVALVAAVGRGRRRGAVVAGLAAYGAAVALETIRTGRRGLDAVAFAGGLAGLHVASAAGISVGVVDGVAARATGRPDDRAASGEGGGPWGARC